MAHRGRGRPNLYGPTTSVTVRLEDELLDPIDRLADQLRVSRTGIIRAMLEFCLAAVEQGDLDLSVTATPDPNAQFSTRLRPRRR